jgi:hypothetical protein
MLGNANIKGRWAPLIGVAIITLLTVLEYSSQKSAKQNTTPGVHSIQARELSKHLPGEFITAPNKQCEERITERLLECKIERISDKDWRDAFLPALQRTGWSLEPQPTSSNAQSSFKLGEYKMNAKYVSKGSFVRVQIIY